jgi:hypothetical protein
VPSIPLSSIAALWWIGYKGRRRESIVVVVVVVFVMLIPALVFAVIVAFAAVPVAVATIIVFITVAIVSVVAVRPVASSTVRGIAVLVAKLEGVPVISADSRHTCCQYQRSVVTVNGGAMTMVISERHYSWTCRFGELRYLLCWREMKKNARSSPCCVCA